MPDILEASGLNKKFVSEHVFAGIRHTVQALKDVSLTLARGKILAVVGESGSGKTTLARCVAGLETPDSGVITFEGSRLDYSSRETRRKIQYIFQDTYNSLNPRMRVSQIIEEPLVFHYNLKGQALETKLEECLDMVGLPVQVREKYPHELSGGQRQRVGIARSLTVNPDLLIADEPVSSLDVSVQAQILKLFVELNRNRGISIIFITHDLRIVKSLADHIIVMNQGEIVERGEVDRVYAAPENKYTKLLLTSIPNSPYKF